MTEEEIIIKIRENNPDIYTYLMEKYSKLMWLVSSGILNGVGSKEDIEDCVAESFIKLWEQPEKFDQNRGSIKTYLCIITKSLSIDKVRKINKITTLPIDEIILTENDKLEESIIEKESAMEIYSYAKKMKEPDSEIFILRYFYELKPSEIADKLCVGVKEVTNRLYNSKKSLLKHLKVD